MDKKTITFLIGMTLIFFLMNQWFRFGQSNVEDALAKQPHTEVVFLDRLETVPSLNKQQRAQYNIEGLWGDIDLKEFLGWGIRKKDNFFSLAANLNLPEYAFIQFVDEGTTLRRRIERKVGAEQVGQPYLYSVYPISKIDVPWIPEEGVFKIAAIYFDDGNAYRIKGETFGIQKIIFNQKPPKNAIIFLENNGVNDPYAFYDSTSNRIIYLDHYPPFENFSNLVYPEDKEAKQQQQEQDYYVLENAYFQLVFSNINGALSEINLPFKSEMNSASVVREIGIDRIMEKDYSFNDTFPQYSYFIPDGKGGKKKVDPVTGGYYPLLRRDIIGIAGDATTNVSPHYYALNVFEQDKTHELVPYRIKRFEKNLIEFEFVGDNRRITKTYTLPSDPELAPYTFDVSIKVDGDTRKLNIGLGIPEVELISGSFTPSLKYQSIRNQKPKIEEIKPPKALVSFSNTIPTWSTDGNGFFGIILQPLKPVTPGLSVHPISGELVPSRITLIDSQYEKYPTNKYPGYMMQLPLMTKPGVVNYHVFAGPFDQKILKRVDQTFTNPATGYNPNFLGAKSYYGWFAFISQPFAKFLYLIMDFFHTITRSWGISIILLTIVLRLMLYPLNNWSMKANAKMQKIAPKTKEIQEKYKKDPKRVQLELMNLYRREGVNPFSGCLPLVIQIPFLFGMFDLLKTSFELRGAPFIPGWINNLSAPDVLFSWSQPLPLIGNTFHLLPIILGAIMFLHQKVMSPVKPGQTLTDQQKQQRFTGNLIAIASILIFYKFPSGLNIYWISSTLLGILQQWWTNKQISKT